MTQTHRHLALVVTTVLVAVIAAAAPSLLPAAWSRPICAASAARVR